MTKADIDASVTPNYLRPIKKNFPFRNICLESIKACYKPVKPYCDLMFLFSLFNGVIKQGLLEIPDSALDGDTDSSIPLMVKRLCLVVTQVIKEIICIWF